MSRFFFIYFTISVVKKNVTCILDLPDSGFGHCVVLVVFCCCDRIPLQIFCGCN